ncbi:MAG TPA: DUF6529 family protein [Actinomycetes bacterium]|jgi:hypothetical protein
MRQQGATLAAARAGPRAAGRLAVAGGLALVVAVALYTLGRAHTPDYTMGLLGWYGLAADRLKAQLGTAMLGLALVQLTLALWMYRRLPGAGAAPPAVPLLHRAGGATLFLLSLPVAVHCLLAYGVQLGGPRVAVDSLAGCFFYGAFAAKVLLVRSRRLPAWALPVAGGLLVTLIAVLWYSSALWYFDGSHLPLP